MARTAAAYWLLAGLVLAQKVIAQDSENTDAPAQKPSAGYNGGDDNPVDPSDAGAAGAQKGGFTLSKGGLAAIIVVIALVVVVGVSSAVLFWLAKKRQWDVRQSLRRASRRLTGRSTADLPATKRQNRRTGVRLNSPPAPRRARPGREKDVEKGLQEDPRRGKTTTNITSTFDVETPTPKGWKGMMLPGKK
ncbi:hypothetical protein BU23DRAFT_551286 [Bimuria novae-zelandiae CBS 107.79]|uniref:Mid2 domain-containing protein n=1 Tax=Bimuria novae-zelandiae CBS 107.79 TaxID=1447943 RepID=A0A6A5VI15_9PLEO|nr:hypothetical protein BU23DRAFT_551286 [Bimuria novae-zelandiae CBS 107.79]